MINLDVGQLLLPNFLTVVVQLLSTLVLFLVFKKLLWKPVREIMQKRTEKMQEGLDNAAKVQEDAKAELANAKEELVKAKEESKEIVANAKKEATDLKEQMIKDAKKQAQAKLDDAENKISIREKESLNAIKEEMVNVAMAAVTKLMDEKATSNDDSKAIREYVDKETKK